MDRINYQDNVITASKFVSIGGRPIGSKEKLNAIRNTLGNNENLLETKRITDMFTDGIITPQEKAELKSRWEFMTIAYSRLSDDIKSAFGESGLSGYSDMNQLVNEIDMNIQLVTADMNTQSAAPEGLEAKLNEFMIRYGELSQVYSSCIMELLKYEVTIRSEKSSYFDGDIVNVIPTVKYDGKIIPNDDLVFDWFLDEGIEYTEHLDNHISFNASDYSESTSIRCSLHIDVTSS